MELYKNAYIIAIYEENDDDLFTVVNNVKEFAELFNVEYKVAAVTLSRIFNKKTNYIRYKGRRLFVYFINDREVEDDN